MVAEIGGLSSQPPRAILPVGCDQGNFDDIIGHPLDIVASQHPEDSRRAGRLMHGRGIAEQSVPRWRAAGQASEARVDSLDTVSY